MDNRQFAGNEFLGSKPIYYKKRKLPWLLLSAVIFLIALIIILTPLVYNGIAIARTAQSVKDRIEPLRAALDKKDWPALEADLQSIENDLLLIKSRTGRLGPILWLPAFANNVKSVQEMLQASTDLLSGYDQLLVILSQRPTTPGQAALGFATPEQKKNFLQLLSDNESDLAAAEAKVTAAKKVLEGIDTNSFVGLWKSQLLQLNGLVSRAVTESDSALPILSRLPQLTGLDQEKNYLFVFQNNMELRPTGGFIGSYGLLTLSDGDIAKFVIDDIYNLDKLSEGKLMIPAPEPMAKYNNQKYLFFRDANWSPDWPTSARQLLAFYDAEAKNAGLPEQKFDGVIALTPDFIANILAVTGPLTISGVTFTKDNFARELEQYVEFEYVGRGIAKESRKSIMGPLSQALIAKMEQMPAGDLLKLWQAFNANINEKNILVYLQDQDLENYFLAQNWSGAVKPAPDDYLMIVDSNLAALKTDSVMTRSISYSVSPTAAGDLLAHLEITYQHNSPAVKNLITKYRTYVRIYVPDGSWFVSSYLRDKSGTKNLVLGKDFEFSSDLGKKVGATFLEVLPQQSKTLVMEYRLPDSVKKLSDNGLYQLLVQKQPGTIGHNLKIELNFNKQINAYQSELFPRLLAGRQISWQSDLNTDKEFTVKF